MTIVVALLKYGHETYSGGARSNLGTIQKGFGCGGTHNKMLQHEKKGKRPGSEEKIGQN